MSTVTEVPIDSDGVARWELPVDEDGLLALSDCDRLSTYLETPPDEARIIILSAPSGGPFCLGRERTASALNDMPGEVDRLIRLNEAIRSSPLLSIARVSGDAAGFGVGIAALTDIALANPEAKFRFPEVDIGLAPTLVLSWLAPLVGRRTALWLAATGLAVSADRAAELGFVSEVVPGGSNDMDRREREILDLLLPKSARVHREIREYINIAESLSKAQANQFARDRLIIGSLRRGT